MNSHKRAALVNTRCIQAACERLGIPYTVHDEYGNFLCVHKKNPYYFVNFAVPFNNGATDRICKDKEFTHNLLKDVVRVPRTKGYFDPHPANEEYAKYIKETTHKEIAEDIERTFGLPVIVKMNSGLQGKNVFLCLSQEEVQTAIETIFDKSASFHDYVATAQEYIERAKEYRAILFRGSVLLVYEKDISGATYVGNISPLHYENARAVHVTNPEIVQNLETFMRPAIDMLGIEFVGVDVIENPQGAFCLIELNTQPGFAYFAKDNGEEALISMYEKILAELE